MDRSSSRRDGSFRELLPEASNYADLLDCESGAINRWNEQITFPNCAPISISGALLNVEELKENLYNIRDRVRADINRFKTWLRSRESEVESKYLLNDLLPSERMLPTTFLKRLNVVIPKLKRYENTLSAWHSNFQESIFLAIEHLNKYSLEVHRIKSLTLSSDTASFDLFSTRVAVSRRRLSTCKSLQTRANAIRRAERKFITAMATIRTESESFSRGRIKVNKRHVNLTDVEKLIDGLMETDSPLERVRMNLSNNTGQTETVFNIQASNVSTVRLPERTVIENLTRTPARIRRRYHE